MAIKVFDKLFNALGYEKKSAWESFFLKAKEVNLFSGKVTEPYKQNDNVYKAVKAIGDNVQQVDLKFYKGDQEIDIKDLTELLNDPNPLMSFSQLLEATVIYLSLRGNAMWWFTKSVGQLTGTRKLPAEIWTFNPDHFTPVVRNETDLVAWRYKGVTIPADEVIHFRLFNPYDPIKGLSPTDPITKTIDLDYTSLIYNSNFFNNNAEPGFMLSTDNELSDSQYKRLKAQWDNDHKGFSKAFRTAILEGGLKPINTGSTHRDMQFSEQKRLNREDILGIWRVPKSLFSITDNLNYATFIGQKKMFWTETVMPLLRNIEDKLNSDFFPVFLEGIHCRFDYSNVLALQEDLKEKVATAKILFDMGINVRAINSKLELGFEDNDLPDGGFLPFGLMPAEMAGSQINQDVPNQDNQKSIKQENKKIPVRLRNEQIWQKFVKVQDPLEKKFESKIRRFFLEQRGKVLSHIDKSFSKKENKVFVDLSIGWDSEDKRLQDMTKPIYEDTLKEGLDFSSRMTGLPIDFTLFDPVVSSLLHTRMTKIKDINKTVRKQLRTTIDEGVQKGETINELASRVKSVYNMASSRAKVIARTETAGAFNGANVEFMKANNIQKKEWSTSRDHKVRDTHRSIEGEVISVNKLFSNGVDHPGGNGPAGEVINCRCVATPYVEED